MPDIRIVRIDERSEARGRWQQLTQQAEPFAAGFQAHGSDTGDIAAGSVETGDETKLDRVPSGAKHDRNRRGRGFGGQH